MTLFGSKTYALLALFATLALLATLIAAAFFNVDLWDQFYDLIKIQSVGGVGRGIANDGAPRVAAAMKNGHTAPNSGAAIEADSPFSDNAGGSISSSDRGEIND